MATVKSPFPISGSVGDLTFYTVGGKTFARNKPGITRDKFLTHPKLQRSRENAQTFGGASKIACAIYRTAKGTRKRTAASYSHNRLIARIVKGMNRRSRDVQEITFLDVAHLLPGLDLSRGQEVSKRIGTTTIGPNHAPTHLRLTDIQSAASLVQGRLGGRTECRIELSYIRFPEVIRQHGQWTFNESAHSHLITSTLTEWIPTDIIPKEGLKLSLHHAHKNQPDSIVPDLPSTLLSHQNHQPQDQPDTLPSSPPALIFLKLEWRHINEEETKATQLPDQTILRLVALQMDEATAQALAAQKEAKQAPKSQEIPQDWRKSPQAYLQKALGDLQEEAKAPPE